MGKSLEIMIWKESLRLCFLFLLGWWEGIASKSKFAKFRYGLSCDTGTEKKLNTLPTFSIPRNYQALPQPHSVNDPMPELLTTHILKY